MTDKENALNYLKHLPYEKEPDRTMLSMMGPSDLVEILDIPVRERPMTGSGYDIFGVHWSKTEGTSHRTPDQKPIYDDITEWREQIRFPNIEKFEWEDLVEAAKHADRENKLIGVVMYNGPFERTTMLTSFEDCLLNLIMEPEDFADLIGAIADYKIQLIHKIWDCAQPDFYTIHDDWGTQMSTFMSPDLWREVVKPHTQRIYDAIHSHGAIIVQHSCGAITPLIGDMVEMGADAWDGQDNCNDFPALKAQYEDRLVFIEKPAMVGAPPEGLENAAMAAAPPPMANDCYGAYAEYPEFLYA